MSPGLFTDWRNEWRLRRGAAAYVEQLLADPDAVDVSWLAAAAAHEDDDRARWELRYARRALGVLVAQRDALDDRTASEVARALETAMHNDRHIAADKVKVAERQLNERLGVYRDVLTTRRPEESVAVRLGRALLGVTGVVGAPPAEAVDRAAEILARYLSEANDVLRKAFGTASLPDDVPPSAARTGKG